MPSRNLFVIMLALGVSAVTWAARDRSLHGRRFGEVLATIEQEYIEPVDSSMLFDAAVEGVFEKLDENSRYVPPSQRASLEASLDLEFGGVGLELVEGGPDEHLVVESPIPGSPAWKAGLVAGDRILAIDGTSTRGMRLNEAVTRLRGRRGDRVVLTVAGAGADASLAAVHDVSLVRDTIRIESVLGDRRRDDGGWTWRIEGRPELALVRIASFGEHTAADFEKAISEIRAEGPLEGLVLDLRDNPGGLVSAAVDVCDHLLDPMNGTTVKRTRTSPSVEPGLIVSTVGRTGGGPGGVDRRLATDGDLLEGIPIAVLVDEGTASAAEIVAASLQDHRRGRVFGGRTFGKGTVQRILPLSFDDGLLKLTTSEYLRPSGLRIHRHDDVVLSSESGNGRGWGVVPDSGCEVTPTRESSVRLAEWRRNRDAVRPATSVVAAAPPSAAELPEQIDDVLRRALEWFSSP